MESFEVIKTVTEEQGIKRVAGQLGLSASMLYKWTEKADSSASSGSPNPLDRVHDLMRVTGNNLPVKWLAEKADGIFIKNPPSTELMQIDVLSNTQTILKEFSELLDVVSRSIQNDGIIDTTEAARIRQEWEDLKQSCEGFVRHCESSAPNNT